MNREVFLDSSFVIAFTSPRDQYHLKAVSLANELEALQPRVLTTIGVLLEVGNALAKRRMRADASRAIASFRNDTKVEIIPIDATLFVRGFELYQRRQDKEWGLVDCVSFVVMNDHGLIEALTSDEHFEQAGFVALLRQ